MLVVNISAVASDARTDLVKFLPSGIEPESKSNMLVLILMISIIGVIVIPILMVAYYRKKARELDQWQQSRKNK